MKSYSLMHCHSHFSLLDGYGEPKDNVKAAKELGLSAIGISDHGNCFGHVQHLEACKKNDIKCILGNELYISHYPAHIKNKENRYVTHMVVFAKNKNGWFDLIKLTSQTNHPDCFYYKPRISLYNDSEHPGLESFLNGNIIGISGHMGSHLSDNLFCDLQNFNTEEKARLKKAYSQYKEKDMDFYKQFLRDDWLESTSELALKLQNIFGKGNFFVELQNECNQNDKRPLWIHYLLVDCLRQVAKKTRIPAMASSDPHYPRKEDAPYQKMLVMVNMKETEDSVKIKLEDEGEDDVMVFFASENFYIHPYQEMAEKFTKEELDQTVKISDQIEEYDLLSKPTIPEYEVSDIDLPYEDDICITKKDKYLMHLCIQGASEKRPWEKTKYTKQEYWDRLQNEMQVIVKSNLSGYFLVMYDICMAADNRPADYSFDWQNNKNDTDPIAKGPGRGCLDGDVKIWTHRGYIPIKDVKIGDKVINCDGKLCNIVNKMKYSTGNNEKLLEIKSYYGNENVVLTKNHKIFSQKQNKETNQNLINHGYVWNKKDNRNILEWTQAQDLCEGDWVVTPNIDHRIVEQDKNIDLSKFIPNILHKGRIEFDENFITEYVPKNESFEASIRDIAKKYRICRNTVKRIVNNDPKVRQNTLDKFTKIIKNYGFNNITDWIIYHNKHKYKINKIKRYINIKDLSFLMGIFVSDGWIRNNNNTFIGFAECLSKDTKVIPKSIYKTFGIKSNHTIHKTKDLIQYYIYSWTIHNFIKTNISTYNFSAQTKSVPDFIWNVPKNSLWQFVYGLWKGDGSHSQSKSVYTTTSKKLSYDLRTILNILSVPNSLKKNIRYDNRPNFPDISISFTLTTPKNFKGKLHTRHKKDKKYIYTRIRSIKEIESKDYVYDIEVDSQSSYLTSSFIVHNSAAGCLISYLINITKIDPIKYRLVFSRFYNEGRNSGDHIEMPDIDLDFAVEDRDWILDYIKYKYGEQNVGQIVTFQTMAGRAALKDIFRIKNIEGGYELANQISKHIPDKAQIADELREINEHTEEEYGLINWALDNSDDMKEYYQNESLKEVFDYAIKCEGRKRGKGKHPSGIIVTPMPIKDYFPLVYDPRTKERIIGMDMNDVAKLGGVKLDILGISVLDKLKMTQDLVNSKTPKRKKIQHNLS